MELWTVTHFLLDCAPQWQMQVVSPVEHGPGAPTSPPQCKELSTPLNEQYPTPYRLVRLQIQALSEKKASKLSKSILNELEKRLLQRPQCQGFETFLVALILLSCVERISWLFHTWNTNEISMIVRPLFRYILPAWK